MKPRTDMGLGTGFAIAIGIAVAGALIASAPKAPRGGTR